MADRLRILEATDEHAPLLAAFFRETWDPTATAEGIVASRRRSAAENPCEPATAPPTVIAVQANRILGYCSSLPLRLNVGASERPAYWAKGLMVLPEFRGGPIGFHVLSALSKSRPLMAAVTVAEGSKRLFRAIGYRDLGPIPNLVRATRFRVALQQLRPTEIAAPSALITSVLRVAEIARSAGFSPALGRVIDTLSAVVLPPKLAADAAVTVEPYLAAAELDALWDSVRATIGAASVRDAAAWEGRYGLAGTTAYHFLALRRSGQLRGVAVLRTPKVQGDARLAGLRMASISDLLIRPDEGGIDALLAATEVYAASLGAGAVILSVTNRRIVDCARRRGYWVRKGNIHFLVRDTATPSAWPESLEEWWLTRGDGESDATF